MEGAALVAVALLVSAQTSEVLGSLGYNIGPEHDDDSAYIHLTNADIKVHLRVLVFFCA